MFHKVAYAALGLAMMPMAAAAQEMVSIGELPAGTYDLDETHASITWQVSHMGLSRYTARFTDFDATVDLDPDNLANSSLTVIIDPASIETDYPYPEEEDFNGKLAMSENWFNAEEYPEITFESTDIQVAQNNENMLRINGDLTMLGTTQPLTLNVRINGAYAQKPMSEKPAFGISAASTLTRSDWGLDTHVPMIGDEVGVLVEAEFEKADE